MKQQYLICQLSAKNKLTVIQKANVEMLKQIELNLALAKKFIAELRQLEHSRTFDIEYYYKKENELTELFEKQKDIYFESMYSYVNKYDGMLVIPYTKILE